MRLYLFQLSYFLYYHGWKNLILFFKPQGRYTSLKLTDIGDFFIRSNNFTDLKVINYVFKDATSLPRFTNPGIIVDLGSNIGMSIKHYRYHYPNSHIYGVEMDNDNFLLLDRNVARMENVHILNLGVAQNSDIRFYSKSESDSHHLVDNMELNTLKNLTEVRCISINDLVKESGLKRICFMKIDIEGTETELFKGNLEWLQITSEIFLEIHTENDFEFIKSVLEKNSFYVANTWKNFKYLNAFRKGVYDF